MKTLTEFSEKSELEVLRANLYASLPPNIRLILEKPFKCTVCGERFKSAKNVHRHAIEVYND